MLVLDRYSCQAISDYQSLVDKPMTWFLFPLLYFDSGICCDLAGYTVFNHVHSHHSLVDVFVGLYAETLHTIDTLVLKLQYRCNCVYGVMSSVSCSFP